MISIVPIFQRVNVLPSRKPLRIETESHNPPQRASCIYSLSKAQSHSEAAVNRVCFSLLEHSSALSSDLTAQQKPFQSKKWTHLRHVSSNNVSATDNLILWLHHQRYLKKSTFSSEVRHSNEIQSLCQQSKGDWILVVVHYLTLETLMLKLTNIRSTLWKIGSMVYKTWAV